MILVDAGPLIALIHKDDAHHARCVATLQSITEPLGTVWPALTEAMYLLSFSWKAQDALWEMVERGIVELLTLDGRDMSRARDSMKKYKDLPMDLADAALVAVAEREKHQAHLYARPSGFRKLPSGKTRPVHHTA
jgi:uncharacterized protein